MSTPGALGDWSARRFAWTLALILLLGLTLRTIFPLADPPWRATVGIVWHDEGAWVHNARNRVLFGAWRLDEWNPMYVAPVFTGLEYASFRTFGVGLWQARLVSEVMGLLSVALLGLAVARAAGRRAGAMAAGLLATSYVFVMWNRAALLETTMTGFLVVSFLAYVRAQDHPRWGLVSGTGAWLAFFSKAAAAFFLPALALVALWPVAAGWLERRDRTLATPPVGRDRELRAGWYTVLGLLLGGLLGLAVFVLPNWHEYWFYNWQMSVTRKPSYSLRALADRVSWLPILHDFFTRAWFVLVVAICGVLARLRKPTQMNGAERLLMAWLLFGVLELIVHDVGNERRLLFLLPAMAALAAVTLGRDGRLFPADLASIPRRHLLLVSPIVLYALYLVVGALGRLPFLYRVGPGVRLSAVVALALGGWAFVAWPRLSRALAGATIAPRGAVALVALAMAGDVAQFTQWSLGRTYKNIDAMRRVAEALPPDTLVHGKLANGLALESRIRPVFVGRGFGNYADRLSRDDIRYVLTYITPEVAYEGPVILDVLEAYPERRVRWTVPVAETACGCDAAALVEKRPSPGDLLKLRGLGLDTPGASTKP